MKLKRKKQKFPMIRCPYCFAEFSHTQVCFKALTTKPEPLKRDGGFVSGMGAYEQEIEKAIADRFAESVDREFDNFWKQYPDSEPRWKYKNYPVITPENYEMMKNGDGYRTDKSGFTNKVIDYFGNTSDIRICPHCHNQLPNGYGKYPTQMIALLGITQSGKTVYLSQLMSSMGDKMSKIGMAAFKGDGVEEFIRENPVKEGTPLPMGTVPEHLSAPLFYDIKNKNQTYTLVFYDIAGENCIDPERLDKYGAFVRNSDGIILLLAPEQFKKLSGNYEQEIVEPEAVVGAMRRAFIDADNESGRSGKPVAVVLSKGDVLVNRHIKPFSSNIYQDISYAGKKGFNEGAFERMDKELRAMLAGIDQGKTVLESMEACFERYGFFTVTVLDKGVEEVGCVRNDGETVVMYQQPVGTPSAGRLEEALFWILAQNQVIPRFNGETKRRRRGWLRRIIKRFLSRE